MKQLLWLGSLVVLAALWSRAGSAPSDWQRFGRYEVWCPDTYGTAVVRRDGRILFRTERLRFANRVAHADCDGDGLRDLVVSTDHGGSYPYRDLYLLRLEPDFQVLLARTTLPAGSWSDRDRDGHVEVHATDTRAGPFKQYPPVVLRLEAGQLVPDPVRMAQSPLPEVPYEDLRDYLAQAARFDRAGLQRLRVHLNRYLYAGRADLAVALLDRTWPDGAAAEREDFVRRCVDDLRDSPYWSTLEAMSGPDLVRFR